MTIRAKLRQWTQLAIHIVARQVSVTQKRSRRAVGMLGFEADERIRVTREEFDRFKVDVEAWRSRHDELATAVGFGKT